jgi:hypothetical protein
MEYKTEKTDTGVELLRDAFSYPDALGWRDLVILVLMSGVLLITNVLFIITLLSMWVRHRYKRDRGYISRDIKFRPLPIICVFLIMQLFMAREFYTAVYPPDSEWFNIFKGIIGLLTLVIAFYGYRRVRNHFHLVIIFAVLLLACADIVMTTNFTAGMLLQIAVFVLLCGNFIRVDRPGVFRFLVWILLSSGLVWLLTLAAGHSGHQWYLEIAYIITGAALVVSAFTYSARTSRGSVLLFASGILMILNTASVSNIWVSFASAALYYIAVCALASTGSGYIIPRISSEYEIRPEKDLSAVQSS